MTTTQAYNYITENFSNDFVVSCMFNYFNSDQLTEFMQYMKDEAGY